MCAQRNDQEMQNIFFKHNSLEYILLVCCKQSFCFQVEMQLMQTYSGIMDILIIHLNIRWQW